MVDQNQEIGKKENWEFAELDPNTTLPLPLDMRYNAGNTVSIVTYSILMVISGAANIIILTLLLKKRGKSKSMINTMFINLAIADLLVTFLMMPLEIGWNSTVSWESNDAMCRIMAFFRIFGLYLSGFVIMCISIDRYFAVLKPFCQCSAKMRGTVMLSIAWISSIICSAPQIAIFHVEHHPNYTDYYQCVTFNFFESELHDLAYKYFGLVMMYGLPLCVILFCYSSILCEIYKRYRDCSTGLDHFRRPSAGFLGRARIKTLKLTVTIVTVFIVCWTPYYVMSVWYWIDKQSAKNVDQRIQKGLFIFACANSIMNPVVYGIFNVRAAPERKTTISPRGKISAIPDVINPNVNDIESQSSQMTWLKSQKSFTSDKNDTNAPKMKPTDSKLRFFRWRFHAQRSFSSEGTDLAETNGLESIETVVRNPESRSRRWRESHQLSRQSDISNEVPPAVGWRSWLSHHHSNSSCGDTIENQSPIRNPKWIWWPKRTNVENSPSTKTLSTKVPCEEIT